MQRMPPLLCLSLTLASNPASDLTPLERTKLLAELDKPKR